MKDAFLERLAKRPLVADGAMGTLLYSRGISFEHCFDSLNLDDPKLVASIHRQYINAGAELIETNTFGSNYLRLKSHGYENILNFFLEEHDGMRHSEIRSPSWKSDVNLNRFLFRSSVFPLKAGNFFLDLNLQVINQVSRFSSLFRL